MVKLYLSRRSSPLGELLFVTNGVQLCALEFADHEPRMLKYLRAHYGDFSFVSAAAPHCEGLQPDLSDRIQAYFAGDYGSLLPIPITLKGTPFQQQVWAALREIPPGTTVTYGQLATQLGNPNGSRAVGMANALNPVAIAIPCHRVIGANAKLTGYAGGIERKRWLLEHEGFLEPDDMEQTSLPLLIP